MSDTAKVFDTLEELLDSVDGVFADGQRPYRVGDKFVASNSQGQAALAVCEVEPCSRKEIMDAMVTLLQKRSTRSSDSTSTTKAAKST